MVGVKVGEKRKGPACPRLTRKQNAFSFHCGPPFLSIPILENLRV
jgi:hypothetical protein